MNNLTEILNLKPETLDSMETYMFEEYDEFLTDQDTNSSFVSFVDFIGLQRDMLVEDGVNDFDDARTLYIFMGLILKYS